MNVICLDLETTGRDVNKDRITEIGAIVWSTEHQAIIDIYSSFIHPGDAFLPLNEEVREVTGIRDEWLEKHGRTTREVFNEIGANLICIHDVQYIVAHNAHGFDRPMILSELKRQNWEHPLGTLPWIDTMLDLPFKKEPRSRSLESLAVLHGFINPFPHRALMDALTMCKILGHYDFAEVVALSQEPWIYLQAKVTYENREMAKDLRYSWEKLGDKIFSRMWVKRVREKDAGKEEVAALQKGFTISRLA